MQSPFQGLYAFEKYCIKPQKCIIPNIPHSANRYQIIREVIVFQGTQSVTSRVLYVF